MQNAQDEVFYSFLAEWYDPAPQLTKQYLLKYFEKNNEVEMVDLKSRRLFLKRSPCPAHMTRRDFTIGFKVILYGRDLKIAGYGDKHTEAAMALKAGSALVLVGPEALGSMGGIIDRMLHCAGNPDKELSLFKLRLFQLDMNEASDVVSLLGLEGPMAGETAERLCQGNVLAGVLKGEDAVTTCRQLEERLLKQYGSGKQAIWVGQSEEQTHQLSDWFFGQQHLTTATLDSCTCCVIKPHAVKDGDSGAIIQHVLDAGYEISALEMFHLNRTCAEEFLEVYRGVIPEYTSAVEHMMTGPCIAMELRAEDAVPTFRQTAGPWDVEMAKELRPNTLRAKFGVDRVRSGVHCTDLPDDGVSECEYFFELLQGDGGAVIGGGAAGSGGGGAGGVGKGKAVAAGGGRRM